MTTEACAGALARQKALVSLDDCAGEFDCMGRADDLAQSVAPQAPECNADPLAAAKQSHLQSKHGQWNCRVGENKVLGRKRVSDDCALGHYASEYG